MCFLIRYISSKTSDPKYNVHICSCYKTNVKNSSNPLPPHNGSLPMDKFIRCVNGKAGFRAKMSHS